MCELECLKRFNRLIQVDFYITQTVICNTEKIDTQSDLAKYSYNNYDQSFTSIPVNICIGASKPLWEAMN